MPISVSIDSFARLSVPFFKERVLPFIAERQQKIITIAVAIFACLAATFLAYQIIKKIFKATESQPERNNRSRVFGGEVYKETLSSEASRLHLVNFFGLPINLCVENEGVVLDQTRFDYSTINLNSEILSNHAVINYKNTSCVEDARVILMGEVHRMPKHLDLEVAIVSNFGKDGDIFLVEGATHEEFIPSPDSIYNIYQSISKNVRMLGWEESLKINEEMGEIGWELEKRGAPEILERVKNLEKNFPQLAQKLFDETLELFYTYIEKGKQRNEYLISSIKRALEEYPESKIFAMAGQLHIQLPGEFNILDHMPDDVKCATLLFKA